MFNPGDKVIICAADDEYAFVDGWRGRVTGFQSGCVEVQCMRSDGLKTLYVPEGQLSHTVGALDE